MDTGDVNRGRANLGDSRDPRRFAGILENGMITSAQYDKLYKRMISLPQEKIRALKEAYARGEDGSLLDLAHDVWHRKSGSPARSEAGLPVGMEKYGVRMAYAMSEHARGTPVPEIIRELGVTEPTFHLWKYIWRRRCAGLGAAGALEPKPPVAGQGPPASRPSGVMSAGHRSAGIALILVAGVLAILAVLASALVTMAQMERRASQQRLNATKAALLARSG